MQWRALLENFRFALKNNLTRLLLFSKERLLLFYKTKVKPLPPKKKLVLIILLFCSFFLLQFLFELFSYQKTDFYLKNLRIEKALKQLKLKKKFFPNTAGLSIRLAEIYLYQNRLEEAYQSLKNVRKSQPENKKLPKVALLLASRIRVNRQEETANQILRYFCPGEEICQKKLLESYLLTIKKNISKNNLKKAEEVLLQVEKFSYHKNKNAQISLLKKDLASAYSVKTRELNRLGKYQKAEQTIRKSIALAERPLDLVLLADLISQRSEKIAELKEAAAYYQKAYFQLNKDPLISKKHQYSIKKLKESLQKTRFTQAKIQKILSQLALTD